MQARSAAIDWVLCNRVPERTGVGLDRPYSSRTIGAGWNGWVGRASALNMLDPPLGYSWNAHGYFVGDQANAQFDYALTAGGALGGTTDTATLPYSKHEGAVAQTRARKRAGAVWAECNPPFRFND